MAATLQRSYTGPVGAGLKKDATVMLQQPTQYYVTPEVKNHLYRIQDDVDHIRLDQHFLNSSNAWQTRFDQRALSVGNAGASAAMGRCTARMSDVKNKMNQERVSNMQDNQVRQLHHWATTTLGSINQDIGPYAAASRDRIRQFCDEVGVTDRYNGYRNNLTRGSRDPVRLGFKWLDNTKPNAYNRSLNVGWTPPGQPPAYSGAVSTQPPFTTKQTTGAIPSLHVTHSGSTMERAAPTASIQEQCGINTTFPGSTEYMNRFQRPPLDRPTRAFTINPKPDFSIYGRPLMRQEFSPNNTEYQARYEWPDGSKIIKTPWRK